MMVDLMYTHSHTLIPGFNIVSDPLDNTIATFEDLYF